MIDSYKGIVSVEILGRKRGFKFGTMQAALFCKDMQCKLPQIAQMLDGTDIEAQISWYWSAAVAYSRLMKEDEPSKDEVAAWIDSYGFSEMEAKTSEAIISPKNDGPGQTDPEPLNGK